MASASGPRRKRRTDRRNRGYEEDFSSLDPPTPESPRSGPRDYATQFRSQDLPPAHSRAQVHGARSRPSPYAQAADPESPSTPPVDKSSRPPWTPSDAAAAGGGGGEPRQGLYRKRDESSSSTVDMEMVELRHPERMPQRTQPRTGGRTYQKYTKSPSSDSAFRTSTHRAVRASAYSTLSVKSWSELDSEVTVVMRDLNKHFKPIFDKHGEEGVSVKKLKEELQSHRSQHLLGRESIIGRLREADRDGDDYLSYGDFVVMITQDLKHERKLAFRGMLLSVLGSIGVLPKRKRDNFLANYKLCPPPLFIPIITLIQVVIFAVYVADMEDRGLEVTANSGYPYYSPLHYLPRRRWEAWRFVTYMFIHDGYLHIIYNVISQVIFGFPLEMVHSWWRTAIIYLTGVAAGSLAHSVVDPTVGLVGASGGVYAILGAHLAAIITNWKEMNYKLCDQEEFDAKPCCAVSRLVVSAPVRLALVVFIVVPDTGLAIVRRVALDEDLRVGVSAHVGGFLTGLFLGIPVLKNVNKHAWETNLGWITLVVFLSVCAFAVFFNSFFDERYPPTDWS